MKHLILAIAILSSGFVLTVPSLAHTASEGALFGGIFTEEYNNRGQFIRCRSANPLTDSCSCPEGFVAKSFLSTPETTSTYARYASFCYKQ